MQQNAEVERRVLRTGREDALAMVITEDRVVYRGLLGAPATRNLGALTLYVALEEPFTIKVDGNSSRRERITIVPPNVPHLITSPDRVIGVFLIEPECIDPTDLGELPALIKESEICTRLESTFRTCKDSTARIECKSSAIDNVFFGRQLQPRRLDRRIALAINQIRATPCEQFFAASCARLTGLSFSRFVHLFKEEIGMTFRAYCAWKRARALLPYVSDQCSLTNIAMKTGYPDSTHFSHSIRRIYGLRPKDIIAGSRRLAIASK
jgi:methylphosphotriester-DNA--protein-cysteine methyltransferase